MIKNAKIVSTGTMPKDYHNQTAKRGTPEFAMSPSSINGFARLPSRWVRGYNPPESKAKTWGSLHDCRVLTPQDFDNRYAVEPETYPCEPTRKDLRTSKPWRYGADYTDKWYDEQVAAGREPVSPHEVAKSDEAFRRLVEPVDGDDTIRRWLDACDTQVQVTAEWHDEETGLVIPLRCLMDFVPRKDTEFASCLGDFKCVRSAHPLRFRSQVYDFGWHRQAAFDMDLFNAATGEQRDTWCFIIQENFPPFEGNRCMVEPSNTGNSFIPASDNETLVDHGRDENLQGYIYWLKLYCRCVKAKRWPTYNSTDETVQGWCILRPDPFVAQRAMFAPKYELSAADEPPEAEEAA